jgi:GH24 family phage-related lysozyme (muramidase)
VFGRSRAEKHAELMRSELNESLDHFMQAANHGASAVGAAAGPRWESAKATVAPRVDQAKGLASSGWGSTRDAVVPLFESAVAGAVEANKQAQKKAKKAKKQVRKQVNAKLNRQQAEHSRKGMVIGLVAVGLAAGAGAAYVARRRRRDRWDTYDASFPPVAAGEDTADTVGETASAWKDSAADKTAKMADKAHNAADRAADKARNAADKTADKTKDAAGYVADKAGDLTDKASSTIKNTRD